MKLSISTSTRRKMSLVSRGCFCLLPALVLAATDLPPDWSSPEAAAATITVGDSPVTVPTGDVFDDISFGSATTGVLKLEDGVCQFGSIVLNRDSQIVLQGSAEVIGEDAGHGITNTELDLKGWGLTLSSPLGPGSSTFSQFRLSGGAIVTAPAGSGRIQAGNVELVLAMGDSSAANVDIDVWGLSLTIPDSHLPNGSIKVLSHVILYDQYDYSKNIATGTNGISFFANVDPMTPDYEMVYTGELQMDDAAHFYDTHGTDWGRAVAFTVPTAIADPNQKTVTYYVGANTFNRTDSIAVCGGLIGEGGQVVYGTLKVDNLSDLVNNDGHFVNLGFAGGKLDLTNCGTSIDLITPDVQFGSVSVMGHPGGGVLVLADNTTLELDALNLRLEDGVLEMQGDHLTIVIDCADADIDPDSFGGFKLPANATLTFDNVTGDTIPTGNLEGSGTVDGGNKSLSVGSDIADNIPESAASKEFNGTLQNVASLEKTGQGTTTFGASANVTTNAATVSEGTLVVNSSNFTVGGGSGTLSVDDGSLMGSGTITGNVHLGLDGQLQPGNSIGTSTINGNLTAQGTIEIEAEPLAVGTTVGVPGTHNDVIDVTGSVDIQPGAVVRLVEDADYTGTDDFKTDDRYYILLSEGDQITDVDQLAFSDDIPDLRIGSYGLSAAGTTFGSLTGTWLWIQLADGEFTLGTTPRMQALSQYLETLVGLGEAATLTAEVLTLGGEDQVLALGQLAGESIGTSMDAVLQNTTVASYALNRQIRPTAPFAQTEPFASHSGAVVRGQDCCVCSGGCEPTWAPWMVGYGLGGRFHGDPNASATSVGAGGFLVGLDRELAYDARAGLFYAYGHAKSDVGALTASTLTDDHLWGGYFVYDRSSDYFLLSGGMGCDRYRSRRLVQIGGLSEYNTSNHDGWQSLVQAEYGLNARLRRVLLQPHFGLQYVYVRQNGFTETSTGNNTHLQVDGVDLNSLRSVLGTRLARTICCSTFQGAVELRAAWMHELLDATAPVYSAALASTTNPGTFVAHGADLGRDWAWLGTGLSWELAEYLSLRCDYDLWLNDSQTLHTGSGSLAFAW